MPKSGTKWQLFTRICATCFPTYSSGARAGQRLPSKKEITEPDTSDDLYPLSLLFPHPGLRQERQKVQQRTTRSRCRIGAKKRHQNRRARRNNAQPSAEAQQREQGREERREISRRAGARSCPPRSGFVQPRTAVSPIMRRPLPQAAAFRDWRARQLPGSVTSGGGDSGSCLPGQSFLALAVGHLDASGAAPGIVTRRACGWDFRCRCTAAMLISFTSGADGTGVRAIEPGTSPRRGWRPGAACQ